jgi:hypothetical protein
MKKGYLILVGFISLLFFQNSCTRIYISEISRTPGFSIEQAKAKKTILVGCNEVMVNEFTKTFGKNYSSNRDFVNSYLQLLSAKLNSGKVLNDLTVDTSEEWDKIRSYSAALDNPKTIDDLFKNCTADYILYISRLEIANRIESRTQSTGGQMNQQVTTTVEYCIVRARFQIIDKNSRKRVFEFESTGEASVLIFAFEKALKDAIGRSIDHTVEYLKTGKKEF